MSKTLNAGVEESIFNDLEQERTNNDFNYFNEIHSFVDTAPTYIPKNHTEQEVYYVNGATYRKYFYINNNWKYITLS